MQIEEGKTYRTRDGRKIGPMARERHVSETEFIWEDAGDISVHSWTDKGGYLLDDAHDLDLIAEWTDEPTTPTLWRDMTPEEKGALLLAEHEGKAIEVYDRMDDYGWGLKLSDFSYCESHAYRVKPQPVRETVTLVGGVYKKLGYNFENGTHKKSWHSHQITFDLIDGNPDCNSVKMEELGK